MANNKIAFFPGSFDPFTKGHQDIVLRALPLFDEIVIGIGQNSNKARYFSLEKMKIKFENILTPYINQPKEYKLVLPKLDKIN